MITSRHHAKRTETVAAPSGNSIASTITQTAISFTLTGGLAVDTAAPSISQSAPGFALSTPVITATFTPIPLPTAATTSGLIPIGSVIGACVGVLIGAVALIILGLWLYRRYTRSLEQHANTKGEQGRRRSHLEPWNKLEEGSEGTYQTKEVEEVENVALRKKPTMFETNIPSRTAYTTKPSDKPVKPDFQSSAQHHPEVAQELASEDKLPIVGQFLGHIDTGPAISWDIGTFGESSYIDPAATRSRSRDWESSKVLQYVQPEQTSADSAKLVKSQIPFENDHSEQRNTGNPFLCAQGSAFIRRSRSISPRSRGGPIQSRFSSPVTMKTEADGSSISKVVQTKRRAIEPDDDPFADSNISALFRSFASHHSDPLSSVSRNDHLWQSPNPALNTSAEDAQECLRIASMQTSLTSITSYTSGSASEVDITAQFSLPPTTEGAIKFH